MAEVTIPSGLRRETWLDRPLLPSWQRIVALTAHWELIAFGLLIFVGLLLRLWDVGGRAMHHDESLHAYYAWKLYVGQGYSYDPLMHGPLQFEVVPLFYLLFGASAFSARLLAVVLGTALIFLPYFLRSYITRPGALLTGLMLAVSPAFVYFSRFIRDDIYLAFFSLLMFVAIVRYIDDPRPTYLYIATVAGALAMASMEAAYITFFIFGSFIAFEGLRELLIRRDGPILQALRRTTLDTWLTCLAIFAILTVLLYSTFFTNPDGIWDRHNSLCLGNCFSLHPQWNTARKDVLGGITYWFAQHSIQRGGQPWFYYLLVLPLYEQLAVVFGVVGAIYVAVRGSLVRTFLVWWAVLALGLYSWAGEKMPWLSIHIALPLILVAGSFLGAVLTSRRRWLITGIGTLFTLLLVLEIHSTFLLNYADAANPTEMLIYVQTSQDVPNVVQEISQLSQQRFGGTNMPIGLDTNDVGGWPFIWYLRDYPHVFQTTSFNGPVCGGQYCPVLLMLDPQYNQYAGQLMSHYVAQKYRWNWWFPEDYKDWFPQHWGSIGQDLRGHGSLVNDLMGSPADRSHLWDWLIYRRPFGDRGARYLYVLVRRDLVPNAKVYPSRVAGAPLPALSNAPSVPTTLLSTLGSVGVGPGQLEGPRGIASDAKGDVYVADILNHRVVVFGPNGRSVASWGQAGTSPGAFSSNSSPQGLAIGPSGLVYVADTWNQRIEVFTPTGRFVRQWGGGGIGNGPGQFYGPRSLAVWHGRVYVADTGNKRIEVFNTKGKYLFAWGTAGTGPGQFQEPSSLAVGPNGIIYVADFWNQRIQAFTTTGSFVRSWHVPDWTPQSYDEPYLTVDSSTGRVFAVDPQQRQVLEFASSGALLGSVGSAQLSLPIGVTVLPGGRLVVSDATANHLDVFKLEASHASRVVGSPQPTLPQLQKARKR